MPWLTWLLVHEGQSLTGAKRGRDSDVTVPAPYRPTGAQVQPGPVLTIP
jgi:hypothetical protein